MDEAKACVDSEPEKFEFEYQGLVVGHERFYGSCGDDDLDGFDKFKEWVYKTEKFFSLAEIYDDDMKLYFAGLRGLAGDARQWFLWNSQASTDGMDNRISSWEGLKLGLNTRFFSKKLLYENSLLKIISLQHTDTIDDYYWRFYKLRHNLDLSDRALTCLFCKGLRGSWLQNEMMNLVMAHKEPTVEDMWNRCRALEDQGRSRKGEDHLTENFIQVETESDVVRDIGANKDRKHDAFELTLVMANGVSVTIENLQKFSGSNCSDDLDAYQRFQEWVIHMENFFSVAQLRDEKKKLLETSKSVTGDARQWFAWRLGQAREGVEPFLRSWEDLKSGLERQFFSERLLYRKCLLKMICLEHTGTMDQYYDEFVILKRNLDLSEQALTCLFFRGLTSSLQAKMMKMMVDDREVTVDDLKKRGRLLEEIKKRELSTEFK